MKNVYTYLLCLRVMNIRIYLLLAFQLLALYLPITNALSFYLPTGQQKCVHDEVDKDEIVIGEYKISEGATSKVSVVVKDSKGHIFFQKADATTGKFTFSTEVDDSFDVCFRSEGAAGVADNREVFIDIRQGAEAKNYDAIAQAENLKPIEAELRKIEYFTDSIVRDFVNMHKRADTMRNINGQSFYNSYTYIYAQ